MKNYIVLESFELNGTEVEVGACVELTDEQAAEFEGKVKLDEKKEEEAE